MGWCLDCHRNPEPHLRPVSEVTNMAYQPEFELTDTEREGLLAKYDIHPSENCSTCHQ
jgi:hypothetical protein